MPERLTRKKGLVVLNPPYGRRLGGQKSSRVLYSEIVKKLQADYRGWRIALLVPHRKSLRHMSFPHRLKRLLHGGLHLQVLMGRIP